MEVLKRHIAEGQIDGSLTSVILMDMCARVEPHEVGSLMHVVKRGTRGANIVLDKKDRINFARSLYYLNDVHSYENWKRDISITETFEWPANWSGHSPLVHILAWTLMPNHFHLLLKEIVDGGIARFMQRLCGSMTKSFNEKRGETGSMFQGSYKGKVVSTDAYLERLVWYVLVKNVLELYPGGIPAAATKFNSAWEWGLAYQFSSFGVSVRAEQSPILCDDDGFVANICHATSFKEESKELLLARTFYSDELGELKDLVLEDW